MSGPAIPLLRKALVIKSATGILRAIPTASPFAGFPGQVQVAWSEFWCSLVGSEVNNLK